jgi:patatin-like phospholipase/acyl hydrolase
MVIDLDFRERIPGHAGVRVLSIDGGGLRGIVPIRILSEIEALTGYKVSF